MKKTILIAGGTAVVSLAVGAAGGIYFTKKRFEKEIPGIIERETEAIKKHYSVMLMEAKSGKPDSPADIPRREDEDESEEIDETPEEELTEADRKVQEKGRRSLATAAKAMTDYQGISNRAIKARGGESGELITNNVFDQDKAVKRLPPRDDSGKFVAKAPPQREPEETPYLIEMEEYLLNERDYEQKMLRYFANDETLIDPENNDEPYEIEKVGAVNLTLFPEVPEGTQSIICVVNERLETMYEIQLMTESLTDYKGLGEDEDDDNLDPAAYL